MTAIFIGGGVAFLVAIFGTPALIAWLSARGIGQQIREDGPQGHHTKAGTPTMGGLATADYAADYARDVAMHFAQAARTIPNVRDLRAWMRGERMVLAARMVLGPAGRSVSRAEMEHAAQVLAAALAERTIPYIRVTFADALEWQAGQPVPE